MIDHDCATTIGGTSRTYDILGNTLTMGATKSMGWDVLNRMTSYTNSGATTTYAYRADGLRVKKTGAGASPTTTYYRYDGQMPVEEFNYRIIYPISYIKILRYALGARGIDRIERVPYAGSAIVGYPLYDAHGNNIATLTIDHANHFSVPASDKRSYGPWGDIRTGSTTGEPQPRHCANLGHLSDDESGFVYMRARYYEPGSGRFISEDPWNLGPNWYMYARNRATNCVDPTGRAAEEGVFNLVADCLSVPFLASVLGMDAGTKVFKISHYGATHPSQYDSGQGAVAMIGILLLAVCGAVIVGAIVAAAATAGLVVGVILVAAALTIGIIVELAEDSLVDEMTNNS